ncbi:MAG: low temperature-induced protein [Patescibacteria group bacterium]
MSTVVMGVFTTKGRADSLISDLQAAGYDGKEISFITRENVGVAAGTDTASAAAAGATTGGVIGGLAGLLIGIGALTIPGVGAFLVGGPIAAALGLTGAAATTATGAMTGALGGGILGGLSKMGVPKEEVGRYEERIRNGGILIAVPTNKKSDDEVRKIMENNDGEDIKTIDF